MDVSVTHNIPASQLHRGKDGICQKHPRCHPTPKACPIARGHTITLKHTLTPRSPILQNPKFRELMSLGKGVAQTTIVDEGQAELPPTTGPSVATNRAAQRNTMTRRSASPVRHEPRV